MDANETMREGALLEVGGGSAWMKKHGTHYLVDGAMIHVRCISETTITGTRCPFNINPSTLEADFELWVCGSPNDYYLIPYPIIRSMYDDPAAYPDKAHKNIYIVNVDLVSDLVFYGCNRMVDATPFRNVTLRELRAKLRDVGSPER